MRTDPVDIFVERLLSPRYLLHNLYELVYAHAARGLHLNFKKGVGIIRTSTTSTDNVCNLRLCRVSCVA